LLARAAAFAVYVLLFLTVGVRLLAPPVPDSVLEGVGYVTNPRLIPLWGILAGALAVACAAVFVTWHYARR
jgi:hypothetical protein